MKRLSAALIMIISAVLLADEGEISHDLPKYENEILKVNVIDGANHLTLRLDSAQQNPIAVYAPLSFEESQRSDVHRFLLPNTQTVAVLEHEHANLIPSDTHTQLVLYGQLCLNTATQSSLIFMIEKK
jgi:hypothetical protein